MTPYNAAEASVHLAEPAGIELGRFGSAAGERTILVKVRGEAGAIVLWMHVSPDAAMTLASVLMDGVAKAAGQVEGP